MHRSYYLGVYTVGVSLEGYKGVYNVGVSQEGYKGVYTVGVSQEGYKCMYAQGFIQGGYPPLTKISPLQHSVLVCPVSTKIHTL